MSITRREVLVAVAVGLSLGMLGTGGADDTSSVPDAAPIKAIIAHFAENGVKLEKERAGNWWVVTHPKGDGYEVIVTWRTFPVKFTEEEMRAELMRINLGFLLNAPARTAMSYPGLRATDPARKLPPLDSVPVVSKLKKLFMEYRPMLAP